MTIYHHREKYRLGERQLEAGERVVVGTRGGRREPGPAEPRRVARHLEVNVRQPQLLIDHRTWANGEYLPTFLTKDCLSNASYARFRENYGPEGVEPQFGFGLVGKSVYIVHTWSTKMTPQDLVKRVEIIANTAKYNGADAVVLLAYTLDYNAQERGVHDVDHPRMKLKDALPKFDGQAPTVEFQLQQYLNAGVDVIITPHSHSPCDLERICSEINSEYEPMRRQSLFRNSTRRYHISLHDVDLAPVVGLYVSDYGASHLSFDLQNNGESVLFLAPDEGAAEFVRKVRMQSGLSNSAIAFMNKKRAEDGRSIELLELKGDEGLSVERGIEGMDILLIDDMFRSGETSRRCVETLRGFQQMGMERDQRIHGVPRTVANYASRSNFVPEAVNALSTPAINDVIITNADPRGWLNSGELDCKLQQIWINFVMGAAAKAVERGESPSSVLTTSYIRSNKLLRIELPHLHKIHTGIVPGVDGGAL